MRARALGVPLLVLAAACGSPATPEGENLLTANVEETDISPAIRRTLIGVIQEEHTIRFPDGEGTVKLTVAHGRGADTSQGDIRVPGADAALYLRSIQVEVVDSAGYELGASLTGNPVNMGTPERPIQARQVQLTRTRSSMCSTQSATMMLRVTPTDVTTL